MDSEDSLLACTCSVHFQLGQVNLKKPGESLLMIRVTNKFIPQPGRSACKLLGPLICVSLCQGLWTELCCGCMAKLPAMVTSHAEQGSCNLAWLNRPFPRKVPLVIMLLWQYPFLCLLVSMYIGWISDWEQDKSLC